MNIFISVLVVDKGKTNNVMLHEVITHVLATMADWTVEQ